MEFELRNTKATGLPETRNEVYGIPMIVWAGVKGNTYDGFTQVFETFCPLEEADGKPIVESKMISWGTEKVAEKYPTLL